MYKADCLFTYSWLSLHLFRPKSHRIEAHLFHHSDQSVGSGGREVLFESYLLDEVQIRIENLLRSVIAQYLNQQGYNAFDDNGIALSLEVDLAIHEVCLQPYTALATLDEVTLCFITFIEWRQ